MARQTNALPSQVQSDIRGSIRRLEERFVTLAGPKCSITAAEILKACVPAAYHNIAVSAVQDLGVSATQRLEYKFRDPDAPDDGNQFDRHVRMVFTGNLGFVYSKTVKELLDHEIEERVTTWAIKMARLKRQWQLTFRVIDDLIDYCDKPQQVRFFAPCIVPLLEMANQRVWADKVRDYKVPREIPATVTGPMREWLVNAEQFITKALTLPNSLPDRPAVRVELADFHTPRRPWSRAGYD